MPIPVQKMSQATADLVEIAAFIAEDNPKAAERFLAAVEATKEGMWDAQLSALLSSPTVSARFLHKTEMCFERGSIIPRRLTIN